MQNALTTAVQKYCTQSKIKRSMENMDTSDRPRKRTRQTSNELGKRTGALQFLHRLGSFKIHEDSDGSYESTVSEILLYLEASTFIEASLARKLHKHFLVNLGFSLKLSRFDHTVLLAECLQVLYRCTWSQLKENRSRRSAESYFGKYEVEEAFFMMLQTLEGLKEKPSRLSTSRAIFFKGTCLQIIRLLILQSPRLREMIHSSRNVLESILYVIVSMPKCSEFETKPSQSQCKGSSYMDIFPILGSLSPTASQMITIAECIMSGNHQRVENLSGSSKADQVFYMNCLLFDGAPERCMKDSGLREAISFTKDECLGENHLSSAVECFRLMIDNWSMPIELNKFFELLVEVLLERSKPNCSSTRVSVKCFELLLRTLKTRYMFLELRGFNGVVQFLTDVVFDKTECKDTAQKAADVLCLIAMALHKSKACKRKELHDPYRLLSSLLSSENPEVFNKTVSCIRTLLKTAQGTRLTKDYCCNLISLLGDSSLHEFTPNGTQQEVVVEILQLLGQRDDTCLNFLTRQPSALSLIVRVASDENRIAPQRIAFSLLLQMSKNACNHKIIARQPGLLSAFFRYTRSANETDDQREKMKEDI
mmetsp:Transcript_24278/g.59440  ORF Transcript_24278/g.59440 Transcript_24278/m.59440 type:complete len:594 (-) Transcript_24278:1421-3202(-)